MPHSPLRPQHIPEVRQLERRYLPHLILEVVAQPQHRIAVLDPHPDVSRAEPDLGHGVNDGAATGALTTPHQPVRKSPTVAVVRPVMRWVMLVVILAVLVYLGNMLWTSFFGGSSLF